MRNFNLICERASKGNQESFKEMQDIIKLAQTGDEEAKMDIINGCEKIVYKLARKMLPLCKRSELNDLYSWGVYGVLQTINKYKFDSKAVFTSVAYMNAKGYMYNQAKKELNENETLPIESGSGEEYKRGIVYEEMLEDINTNIFDIALKDETSQLLMKVIKNNLNESQQKTVILYYFHGLKSSEISEKFGTTKINIDNRLLYCRKVLKRVLKNSNLL